MKVKNDKWFFIRFCIIFNGTRQSAVFQLGSDKHLNLLSDHQVSHGSKFVYEEDLRGGGK